MKDSTITEVIRSMTKTPRENALRLHDEHTDEPIEKVRMIYISSAVLKTGE